MKAILDNWPPIVALLGAFFILLGLKEKGLCRPRISKKLLFGYLVALAGLGGFALLVRLASSSSFSGEDTFAFLSPFFGAIFRLDNKWSAVYSSIRPPIFLVGSISIFLLGLIALALKKRRGRGVFWLAFSLAMAISAQQLLIGSKVPLRTVSGIGHPAKVIFYFLIAVGGAFLFGRSGIFPGPGEGGRSSFWRRWGIVLILLATVLTGFYRLEGHPFTVNEYETDNGLSALQVIRGDRAYFRALWNYMERAYSASAFSPIFVSFVAGLFWISGPGLMVLRAGGVFWGIASLVVLYFMIKDLFGLRPALLSVFLASVGVWYLSVIRQGTYSSLTLFYALLVLFIFTRALKRSPCYFALAGALLGFNNYLYVMIKIIFPLLVLLWIHQLFFNRKCFKKYLIGMALFLAFFFVVSSLISDPLRQLTGVIVEKQSIGMDYSPGGGFALAAAWKNFKINLLYAFHNIFIENCGWVFPAPSAPLLNRGVFLLAILGLGISMGRCRRGEYFLLLIWFLLAILPITLISPLVDRGVGRRGILLMPVIYILAAIPLSDAIKAAYSVGRKKGVILASLGAAIFLSLTALHNINVYFKGLSPFFRGGHQK